MECSGALCWTTMAMTTMETMILALHKVLEYPVRIDVMNTASKFSPILPVHVADHLRETLSDCHSLRAHVRFETHQRSHFPFWHARSRVPVHQGTRTYISTAPGGIRRGQGYTHTRHWLGFVRDSKLLRHKEKLSAPRAPYLHTVRACNCLLLSLIIGIFMVHTAKSYSNDGCL